MPGVPVTRRPHPPSPRSSSLSRVRERAGVRVRRYARRAGIVVIALIALDLIVGTAAVALGWDMLKR